jgi:hypothetical protein
VCAGSENAAAASHAAADQLAATIIEELRAAKPVSSFGIRHSAFTAQSR